MRRTFTVTTSWQVVSKLQMITTIIKAPVLGGKIYFNDADSDDSALVLTRASIGRQVIQENEEITWVRADKSGWRVIIDE